MAGLVLRFNLEKLFFINIHRYDRVNNCGAYHLTEYFGNSRRKVNGKVTFRKLQRKIEEYVLR